ncbi:MAG: nuclear transport factor 2 family protein [Leptospirales bacterium]
MDFSLIEKLQGSFGRSIFSRLKGSLGRKRKNPLSLEQHIRGLEEQLLQPAAGGLFHLEDVEGLLAEDFLEIGVSGRIYNKKQVLQALLAKPSVHCSMMDFRTRSLTRDVILATYRTIRQDAHESAPVHALRSSLWKHSEDRWQMVFHQGTFIKEA